MLGLKLTDEALEYLPLFNSQQARDTALKRKKKSQEIQTQ